MLLVCLDDGGISFTYVFSIIVHVCVIQAVGQCTASVSALQPLDDSLVSNSDSRSSEVTADVTCLSKLNNCVISDMATSPGCQQNYTHKSSTSRLQDAEPQCNYLRSTDTDSDDSLHDEDYNPVNDSETNSSDSISLHDENADNGKHEVSKPTSRLQVVKKPNVVRRRYLHSSLRLFKKKSASCGRKQAYDKCHFCTFCGNKIISKIARHILTVYRKKDTVKNILMLPKDSQNRKLLLQSLVNEGNFKHNTAVIEQGTGEVVVGRRSSVVSRKPSDYTACPFCKKWQAKAIYGGIPKHA